MNRECEMFQDLMSEQMDPVFDVQLNKELTNHLEICADCQMIYQQWVMIRQEIRAIAEESAMEHSNVQLPSQHSSKMASRVMEQIYRQEDWRRPIGKRAVSFSNRMYRTITISAAFFVSVFLIGFLYALMTPPVITVEESLVGIQPIAAAEGVVDDEFFSTTAMASITVPMKLSNDPAGLGINYLLVISMVGLISIMLILNWFSRSKA